MSNKNHELQIQGTFFLEHTAGLFFVAILVVHCPKN